MAKVKCTLPNASAEISGVKFESVDGVMVSEDISDDAAAAFVSISGYELVGPAKSEQKQSAGKAPAAPTSDKKGGE